MKGIITWVYPWDSASSFFSCYSVYVIFENQKWKSSTDVCESQTLFFFEIQQRPSAKMTCIRNLDQP